MGCPPKCVHRVRWGGVVGLVLLVTVVAGALRAEPVLRRIPSGGGRSQEVLWQKPAKRGSEPLRLCVIFPGGPGLRPMADGAMAVLGDGLCARGWAVAVPISPDGRSFFGPNAAKAAALVKALQREPGLAPGKVLLAGVSNGGISALDVAGLHPELVLGVVAVPGLLGNQTRTSALRGLPIFLRIGAQDNLNWAAFYPQVMRQLEAAGAKVDGRLLEGVGHGIPIDWNELERWLQTLTPTQKRVEAARSM